MEAVMFHRRESDSLLLNSFDINNNEINFLLVFVESGKSTGHFSFSFELY